MPPRKKKPDVPRETSEPDVGAVEPDVEEMNEFQDELVVRPVVVKRRSRGGRPSSYKPEYAKIARALLSKGSTAVEVADSFGVTVQTLWNWRNTHQEFFEAFFELNENFDNRVEHALGMRAVGYDYDDVKVFNNNGIPTIVHVRRHMPADVNAAKFWLAARSDKWRIKEEVEVSGDEAFKELLIGMANKKKDAKE